MSSEKMSSDTGASWFGGLKKSFVDVPIDVNNNNAIATTEFLEAAESLSTLFGKGLDFTAQALRHNASDEKHELSTSFRSAYGVTLKPHHGFMVKPIFSAAMSAVPYRKDFYHKICPNQTPRTQGDMDAWLEALEERVLILKQFLARKEAKW
ncbi:hypothetical protein MMC09_005043 [Bachmanniomyces sp. S44760]|nr:hypothetical protein [Bachmanniomyces sp. S44760]